MYSLSSQLLRYSWGSTISLPEFLRRPADGQPWAELWFGTYPTAPFRILDEGLGRVTLAEVIAERPRYVLGAVVLARFGPQLPFLLKLIAPRSRSHCRCKPGRERAREQYAAGIATDEPERSR